MTFGEYIRKLRKRRGKSLRQLAEQVGVTHAYIAQLESGSRASPKDSVVIALANELGEDPDVLLVIAGRIPDGLVTIIQEHPFEFAEILRRLKGAPKEKLDRVAREIRDGKW
jgi:transcriptional regulator with XRE-family HTH domain